MAGREDPRVARSRACILAAATEAIESEGAAGVTVEGVAERAGVAKTTVYRLWADRNELLMAAFEQMSQKPPMADTGDLRADLVAQVKRIDRALRTETWAKVLPALVDQAERDESMRDLCRLLAARRRAGLVERIEAATARGELLDEVDAELVATQLIGPVFFRRFFSRQAFSGRELTGLVDAVLISITPVSRPRAASGSGGRARSRG